MVAKKGGLGRGLDSLFSENSAVSESTVSIKITDIEPNKKQPRTEFDEAALNELAESISKHGLIQPIVVKPNLGGTYTIIAGERRWRACRIAGLESVPVVVKDVEEKEVMELALIENLQRENLNAVEEALGYKSLIDNYGLTQEEVASRVGKSRSTVTNAIRLLSLNPDELEALKNGKISAGHARALLAIEDGERRLTAFNTALWGGSVRDIEAIAKKHKSEKTNKVSKPINNYFKEVELALKEETGRKVSIKPVGKEGGIISFEFYDKNELKEIVKNLTK